MCRWFAYISAEEPCLLADVLIDPVNSLAKQCSRHYLPYLLPHKGETDLDHAPDILLRMRNSALNMDGLGIGWYTEFASAYREQTEGPRPAVYKTSTPAYHDLNAQSICNNTESNCIFGHIRASSGATITRDNCHPFAFGRHLWMHNGVIAHFDLIRRDLIQMLSHDAFCNILGATDSEHAAALYMTNLTKGGDRASWQKEYPLEAMLHAMTTTIDQILALQRKTVGDQTVPSSLNFCATDGLKMVGVRFRNSATEQPPSLYWSNTAGRTLNNKFPGNPNGPEPIGKPSLMSHHFKHTIISSEPTTFDRKQWRLIKKNCALTVDELGVQQEIPVPYDPKYDAKDPYETHPLES